MSQIPENNPDGWPDRAADPGGQQPPGYYGQPGPGSFAPAQPEATPVLSEFDHLFRDSAPDTRRSVSQDGPVVRFGANAPAVPYPNLNPVPPQWPAQPGGPSAELAPVQNRQGQYPVQYEQYAGQQQYPGQDQGQQYQQYPEQGQPQYDQGQYMTQPQGSAQPVEYQQQYQQEQGGYGPPAGYQQDGRQWSEDGAGGGRNGNRTKILVAGGAVVVVIGLIVALNSGGSGKPQANTPTVAATTTAPSASQQASALMAVVAQSSALRSEAITAVDDLSSSSCAKLTADQTDLQATSKARAAQATAVAKLDVSQLPSGAQVVAELAKAWTASATSDDAYALIAGDLASAGTTNCKTPYKKDPNYSAAVQADGDATRAKTSAATLWNSDLATAAGLNLAQINSDEL